MFDASAEILVRKFGAHYGGGSYWSSNTFSFFFEISWRIVSRLL